MMVPEWLFLTLSHRCNLRCDHCDLWRRDQTTTARTRDIMREFAELGGTKVVMDCGGEPMASQDVYFAACSDARECGLRIYTVTNGWHLDHSVSLLERTMLMGAHEISVSIDSADHAKHDAWRGVTGAWSRATEAAERLASCLSEQRGVHIMTLVSERNWRELPELYGMANALLGGFGPTRKLKLNMLQPRFDGGPDDGMFERLRVHDVDGLIEMIRGCDRAYGLTRSEEWLRVVRDYWTHASGWWGNPHATSEQICNSSRRNVMVDIHGMMRSCFSDAFPGMTYRQAGDLETFVRERVPLIDRMMVGCSRHCGISHSVRAEPARTKLLNVLGS